MKAKFLLGTAVGLVLPSLVMAADLPARVAPIAPAKAAPAFTWTGFYVGGTVGALSMRTTTRMTGDGDWQDNFGDIRERSQGTGVVVGGTVGFNYQVGSVVVGVETDLSLSTAQNSFSQSRATSYSYSSSSYGDIWGSAHGKSQISSFGTVRARLGVAFDRTMLYVTGGLAYAKVKYQAQHSWGGYNEYYDYSFTGQCSAGFAKTKTGWTIGAGVEHALTNNLTLKAEALYFDLGRTTVFNGYNAGDPGTDMDCRTTFKTDGVVARVGMNYKF